MPMETGYDRLQQLKKEEGVTNDDLLAMAAANDPCYVGTVKDKRRAAWFRDLFERYSEALEERGEPGKPHLRGMHYWYSSFEDSTTDEGTRYKNDKNSWAYLKKASMYARYLGYVDAEEFADKRHPKPVPYAETDPPVYDECEADVPEWELPHIDAELRDLGIELPSIESYAGWEGANDAAQRAQPYHLEVWCEKSTMDDILEPICEQYGAVYVPAMGVQSLTSVISLMHRFDEIGKPIRIFYISDFDAAGESMPLGVARKIQFWLWSQRVDADIKLKHIILTEKQVYEEYLDPVLPRSPTDAAETIKKKVTGAVEKWDRRHGGKVELDALQALYPGELARIVTEALNEYYDHNLEDRYADYKRDINKALEDARESWIVEPYKEPVADLEQRIDEAVESFREKVEKLQEELDEVLAPYRAELDAIREDIETDASTAAANVQLPGPPESDIEEPDDDEILYDSERDFWEQADIFNQYKPQPSPKTEEQLKKRRESSRNYARRRRVAKAKHRDDE